MNFTSTTQKIKEHGYWQISFHPTKIIDKLPDENQTPLTLPQIKKVIIDNKVQYRGWDYPHCPPPNRTDLSNQGIYNISEGVESWIDWEIYQEAWRFNQSGKFTHLKGLHEDRYNEVNYGNPALQAIDPDTVLDVPETIYTLTEIFAFLRDLMQTPYFLDGIYLSITLKGTQNRKLTVLDPARTGLFQEYKCLQKEVPIFKDKKLSNDELRTNFKELAKETALIIFHQFNWDTPPEQIIEQDQTKLLERKWF